MSWYNVEGMYDEYAFSCVKNTYAICAMALRYFNCSCRLNSMLMYGWMSHQISFECWFKAVRSRWWIGLSIGDGGESVHISCIRLNIVVMSCLSATFRRLLMQPTEVPTDSSCDQRTKGMIWVEPTWTPLGRR